eukprot:gene29263-12507_t
MPRVTVNGGSITGAIVLVGIAFGVQVFVARRRGKKARSRPPRQFTQVPSFFSFISPSALRMLIETNPIQHCVFEVVKDEAGGQLPPELATKSIKILESGLEEFFLGQVHGPSKRTPEWPSICPHLSTLLVFTSRSDQTVMRACALAAEAGYQRCLAAVLPGRQSLSAATSQCVDLIFMSRDALALLLGCGLKMGSKAMGAVPPCVLIDLRRHDECTLYGSIRGSLHIPVDQLPSALQMSPATFEQVYRTHKPSYGDIMVLHSRAGRRAGWAAQLCADAGYSRVFVYKQGSYSWRFDSNVKPYCEYALGEPPPDPETVFQLDAPNLVVGSHELYKAGLISSAVNPGFLQ